MAAVGAARVSILRTVVGKTLAGLFLMLYWEEQKIRSDLAAQITPLLKEIFGKRR
ncbi:MAG: DUF4197 family protein [Acidobacteriota bacterium]